MKGIQASPELVDYVTTPVWQTVSEVCAWAEDARRSPVSTAYSNTCSD